MEPKYRVKPPLSPEENPPDNLEDLEKLIEELEQKALEIKHQIEVAQSRADAGGEPLNLEWYHRVSYALKCTRYSITRLQRIAKKKRNEAAQERAARFDANFVEVAKDLLADDLFEEIKFRAQQITSANNTVTAE